MGAQFWHFGRVFSFLFNYLSSGNPFSKFRLFENFNFSPLVILPEEKIETTPNLGFEIAT